MLSHTIRQTSATGRVIFVIVLCLGIVCGEVGSCSPGRSGARRRSARKLTPLVFKQHVPNVPEHSLGASGPPEGRIYRDDPRFRTLVPNYNVDIVFKDEEGTGVDRLMTRRCQEKLDVLAISVMNMWPGVRLRVTEGFDEDGTHPKTSLHYEGRAVAISTSDRDTSKYGMLARLAVDAGFDWVFYESRSHIYCSVKIESTASGRFSGCFHGSSTARTESGSLTLHSLQVGDEVLSSEVNSIPFYSKVIGFLHRDPDLVTNFVQLTTSSNQTLLSTPDHLVFLQDSSVKHASGIDIGDSLWTASVAESYENDIMSSKLSSAVSDKLSTIVSDKWSTVVSEKLPTAVSGQLPTSFSDKLSSAVSEKLSTAATGRLSTAVYDKPSTMDSDKLSTVVSKKMSTVVSKRFVNLKGVYAPLTESGTIVVDGVVCSCYAVVRSHNLANALFYPLQIMQKMKPETPFLSKVYERLIDFFECEKSFAVFYNQKMSVHWYARLLCDINSFLNNIAKFI